MSCLTCTFYREHTTPNKDKTVLIIQRVCILRDRKGVPIPDKEFIKNCDKYLRK